MTGMARRSFIRQALWAAGAIVVDPPPGAFGSAKAGIEISLAEWSLHRAIYGGKLDHLDFPATAKKVFGISAVEYVNGFFGGKKTDFRAAAKSRAYLKELLTRSSDAGVINHLLMVDDEGPLANRDDGARLAAVENHLKWIEAAKSWSNVTR